MNEIRETYLRFLADDVEHNLERFDEETGRFMTGDGAAPLDEAAGIVTIPLAVAETRALRLYIEEE